MNEDPIEKMRKALEEVQAMAQLTRFAQTSEETRFEKDLNEFVSKAVRPAFDKVKRELFGERLTELTERAGDLGFKVTDFPNSEFWFWIGFRGRVPVPHARRKPPKTRGALVVSTHLFASKQDFELTDVVEGDIVRTISEAYVHSLQTM